MNIHNYVVSPVSSHKPLRYFVCGSRGLVLSRVLLIFGLIFFVLAFAASRVHADDRRAIQGTTKIVSWFTTRDGYGMSVLVNAILERERVTLKCSTTLDPGAYIGDRSDDRVWLRVRNLHNKEREEKCSILRRSWTHPTRS